VPKCNIKGCNEEAGYNPKTGKPNLLCLKHFQEVNGNQAKSKPTKINSSKIQKHQPKKVEVETFVLRGNELTVNTSNRITHHKVDRFTRAVMFNKDVLDRSGNAGRYLIEIKQNGVVFKSLVYTDKKKRNNDFTTLQSLLATL